MKRQFSILILLVFGINFMFSQGKLFFEKKTIDWGTFDTSEPLKASFPFKNIGNTPITINKVILASGDFRVTYPKTPINVHETGNIDIEFIVQDRQAYGLNIKKTISVVTSEGELIRLYITGTQSDEIPATQKRRDGQHDWIRIYQGGKFGAMNTYNKLIINPQYNDLKYFNNFLIGRTNDFACFHKLSGELKFKIPCDTLEYTNDFIKTCNKGFWGIYDFAGNSILPYDKKYGEITIHYNEEVGTCFITKGNNYSAICNLKGKELFLIKEKVNHEGKEYQLNKIEPHYIQNRFVILTSYANGNTRVSCILDAHMKELGAIKYDVPDLLTSAYDYSTCKIEENGDVVVIWDSYFEDVEKVKKTMCNIRNLLQPSNNPLITSEADQNLAYPSINEDKMVKSFQNSTPLNVTQTPIYGEHKFNGYTWEWNDFYGTSRDRQNGKLTIKLTPSHYIAVEHNNYVTNITPSGKNSTHWTTRNGAIKADLVNGLKIAKEDDIIMYENNYSDGNRVVVSFIWKPSENTFYCIRNSRRHYAGRTLNDIYYFKSPDSSIWPQLKQALLNELPYCGNRID